MSDDIDISPEATVTRTRELRALAPLGGTSGRYHAKAADMLEAMAKLIVDLRVRDVDHYCIIGELRDELRRWREDCEGLKRNFQGALERLSERDAEIKQLREVLGLATHALGMAAELIDAPDALKGYPKEIALDGLRRLHEALRE
jgi:hypothetical protein